MSVIQEALTKFYEGTGISSLFSDPELAIKTLVMYVIIGALFYLGIVKKFEPLLLIPIATGMLLANITFTPETMLYHPEFFIKPDNFVPGVTYPLFTEDFGFFLQKAGLIDYLYLGVKLGIYPSLIFLGVGAMTDFTALIANPKSLLLGAAAQFGVFVAFFGAMLTGIYTPAEAGAIGIIGGADGPTAILVAKQLAPWLLSGIAIAAYSYMALIPMIQPPLMKAVTTKKERSIVMTNLRPVSQVEKVLFPIIVTLVVVLLVPDAAPLVGFLMFGNLLNVCGVTERLSKTAQNELINIVTIMLGVSVGATANASNFLDIKTLVIVGLGLVAFAISTLGGLLFAKLMCFLTHGKINPLIGSAGVSAVPMAARVAQDVGRKENPSNFLLMHAMGPNVAGVIGSAVAAGVFLQLYML